MKKVLFTILFFMTFLMANATLMQRVYHKDYGVIDRTVLVFNRALDFKIDHKENVVEILLPNCSRDETLVSNQIFTNSNVLKSFTYRQDGNNLLMTILLNDNYTTAHQSEFSVEYLSYTPDVYKVALDIFATQNPVSHEELLSFVNFYTTIDQKVKANKYKEILTAKIEQDKQNSAEKIALSGKPETQKIPQKSAEDEAVSLKNSKNKSQANIKRYFIPVMIFILVALLIWLIVHILKQGKKVENTTQTEIEPVGREEFRSRVIRKLLDHDWNKRVISLELKVPISEIEEVEKRYLVERANQLESEETNQEDEQPKNFKSSPYFSRQEETIPDQNEELDEPEAIEKPELAKTDIENIPQEKTEAENAEEQMKLEHELYPGEVERESDGADEPKIDESLKDMLEYDSSDNPKGDMTKVLEHVKFNTDDIEEIRLGKKSTDSQDETISDLENKKIQPNSYNKHESDMSKMLRKRFPKTSNGAEIDKSDELDESSEHLPDDPDELLEKAITNKLDELTKS